MAKKPSNHGKPWTGEDVNELDTLARIPGQQVRRPTRPLCRTPMDARAIVHIGACQPARRPL
jgi:hypothetical protein